MEWKIIKSLICKIFKPEKYTKNGEKVRRSENYLVPQNPCSSPVQKILLKFVEIHRKIPVPVREFK